jgi:hypothetical protein
MKKLILHFSFDRLKRVNVDDSVSILAIEEFFRSTDTPAYEALEVHTSSDPVFDYMAHSPYYKAYFKGNNLKMVIGDSWITLSLKNQELGEVQGVNATPIKNTFRVQDVDAVDASYEADVSVLQKLLILENKKEFSENIYEIAREME